LSVAAKIVAVTLIQENNKGQKVVCFVGHRVICYRKIKKGIISVVVASRRPPISSHINNYGLNKPTNQLNIVPPYLMGRIIR